MKIDLCGSWVPLFNPVVKYLATAHVQTDFSRFMADTQNVFHMGRQYVKKYEK